MTPRTVVIPGDGTDSLSFTIPSGVDFNVESVVASVDASGAGDTIGELSIAEVTGEVIATKRQGLPIPAGDSGTETWALRLDDETVAAAGGGYPFCAAGVNGAYNVTTGTMTEIGIDPGALQDSGAGIFSEDTTGGGVTGVAISEAGTYLGVYGVQHYKLANPQVVNPETFVNYAQDVSSSIFVGLNQLGSLYEPGLNDTLSGNNLWSIGWQSLFTTHGATAAGDPVRFDTKQNTGVTLQAYTQVAIFQILPTALF